MPFRFDEFVALVKAGYTKEEIDAMEKAEDEKAAQVSAPAKEEVTPEPEQVEQKAEEIPADNSALNALQAEIVALRKAIQAMNVKNAYRTDDPDAVNAESILASIIQPTKTK